MGKIDWARILLIIMMGVALTLGGFNLGKIKSVSDASEKAEYKCETDNCGIFVSHTWFDRFIQDTNNGGSDKDQSTIHTGFYNGKAEVCLIPFYMMEEPKK